MYLNQTPLTDPSHQDLPGSLSFRELLETALKTIAGTVPEKLEKI